MPSAEAYAVDPLHAAAVEHSVSVLYWRQRAALHPVGSLQRRRALRLARYGEARVVDLAIRAETLARRSACAAHGGAA